MIFTSESIYNKPLSLYFSTTVSGFNFKNSKFNNDFSGDLEQLTCNNFRHLKFVSKTG